MTVYLVWYTRVYPNQKGDLLYGIYSNVELAEEQRAYLEEKGYESWTVIRQINEGL